MSNEQMAEFLVRVIAAQAEFVYVLELERTD